MSWIEQVWNISDFSGGEADGFYNWPTGSYRAGTWLDTRRVENWARATNILVSQSTYTWVVQAVSEFWDKVFSTYTGTTGKVWQGTSSLTLSSWSSTYDKILAFGKMRRSSDGIEYQYWFTATSSGIWNVHRFDEPVNSGVQYAIWTFTMGNTRTWAPLNNKMPIISGNWEIMWAYGNTVWKIDWAHTVTQLLVLPKEWDIVAITEYQDTYKLYINQYKAWLVTWSADCIIAYWGGLASVWITQKVIYKNSPVQTIVNDWPVDYAVFGSSFVSDLYIVQWLIRTPVRNNIEFSENNSRILGTESCISDGIIYILGTDKLNNTCIYSYGKYYPWTPNSLVPENVLSSWTMKFWVSEVGIFVYEWLNIYRKLKEFKAQASSSFKLYTYALRWGAWFYSKKTLKRIDISYRLSNANDSLKLYARTNGWPYTSNSTGWSLVKNITWTTYFAQMGVRIEHSEIQSLNIGNFHQLEYYVEGTNASTDSCILHQIKTTYIDNIND